MNAPDSKDHWKELADEIGAEVPEMPEAAPAPPPAPEAAEPSSPSKRAASPPPPPPEADWDALAADLGLEVEPAPSATPTPPVANEPQGAETPVMPERDKEIEPEPFDPLAAWDKPPEAPSEQPATAEPEARDPLELPPAPDVSFQEFAEEMASDESESMFESPDAEDAREVAERRQRRRRRRGRRGRGESSDEPRVEPERRAEVESRTEPTDEEEAPPRRRRRRARRSSDDRADSAEKAAAEPVDEAAEPAPKKHRNIPTWQEVIGSVIESNLGSRSRSSRGDGRRRRGGRRR